MASSGSNKNPSTKVIFGNNTDVYPMSFEDMMLYMGVKGYGSEEKIVDTATSFTIHQKSKHVPSSVSADISPSFLTAPLLKVSESNTSSTHPCHSTQIQPSPNPPNPAHITGAPTDLNLVRKSKATPSPSPAPAPAPAVNRSIPSHIMLSKATPAPSPSPVSAPAPTPAPAVNRSIPAHIMLSKATPAPSPDVALSNPVIPQDRISIPKLLSLLNALKQTPQSRPTMEAPNMRSMAWLFIDPDK